MKRFVTYVGVTALAAALSSSAFAGEYKVLTPDYQTVTASCGSSATGPALAPGELVPTVSDQDYDPSGPGEVGFMRTKYSRAEFEWKPAVEGEAPASYKIKQEFSVIAKLSANRNRDPRGTAYAFGQVAPNIVGKTEYRVSAGSSDPNQDDPPISLIDTTGNYIAPGTYAGRRGRFYEPMSISAKAETGAQATAGGTGSSASSVSLRTTKISLPVVAPAP